ncbi:unnamed protein product [Menidia menidia]|uniref:Prostate-associated microseminoprotein n=1 Tax=Menidia menidia TaxID=238744 RepID=A0A8S4BUI2_9TELE|nr:unnamed protein product [Menidia menidia]
MQIPVFLCVMAAVGLLLGAGGGLAAPMECHFDSRAQCEFGGRRYSLGDSWMDEACMQCTCLHPVGVGCCQTVHHPVDFPAWCEVRVEPVTCRASLVQSTDPRRPCEPGHAHLDPGHAHLDPGHAHQDSGHAHQDQLES